MSTPPAADTRISAQELLVARSTPEDLANARGMNFGGAGAALATILLIAQIGVGKPALVWALALAAAALPLWIALALTYDAWLILKLGAGDLHAFPWLRSIQAWGFLFCVLLLAGSVGCLLYALAPVTVAVFIAASVAGTALILAVTLAAMYRLRHLWK